MTTSVRRGERFALRAATAPWGAHPGNVTNGPSSRCSSLGLTQGPGKAEHPVRGTCCGPPKEKELLDVSVVSKAWSSLYALMGSLRIRKGENSLSCLWCGRVRPPQPHQQRTPTTAGLCRVHGKWHLCDLRALCLFYFTVG